MKTGAGRLAATLLGALVVCTLLVMFQGAPDDPLVERRVLMDTVVTLRIFPNGPKAREAAALAMARVDEIERLFSGYRPDSPISRLNNRGRLEAFEVPGELRRVLEEALALHAATRGHYHPGLGAVVDLWGFGPGGATTRPPPDEALTRALTHLGLPGLEEDGGVTLPPGTRLDLGGFVKGYAVDEAVRVLREAGVHGLVDAGGDLACTGPKPSGEPWRIGVRDPDREGGVRGVVELSAGALASSGDYERFFEFEGERYHHLLDPASGRPGRWHRQVTVAAPRCALADGWATALFLAAPGTARELAGTAGIPALLIPNQGAPTSLGGLELGPVPGAAP